MLLLALIAAGLPAVTSLTPRAKCTAISSEDLQSYNGTILDATYYEQGSRNVSNILNEVAFCEVNASISYGLNDALSFTIWLPQHYQDRFMAVGNGGMAGTIDYSGMISQLNSGLGMAVAGGDAGHLLSSNTNTTGYIPYLHDVEQVKAWIKDAISLFTPAAKALVEAYYGEKPRRSYYYGCSTGGAQGFALAQYHPELFDGIYAGCPGNWYSHLALSFLWNAQHTNTLETSITQEELSMITSAVLDACDENDGVLDRLIENPLACRFDIDTLACTGSSNATICLSEAKLDAVKAIYAGPRRADTGVEVYPGFTFGSEIEWALQQGNLSRDFSVPILKNLVFDDQHYDNSSFNWASDVDVVNAEAGSLIDSLDPNLSGFRSRKGRLLVHQGWADPYNAATWPIEHLQQVSEAMGGRVDDFYRLVMIPGGGHCGGASYYPTVPATYHFIEPLVRWVESNGEQAPMQFLSTSPAEGGNRTRKLCVWPTVAQYTGDDQDDWNSYTCV